MVIRMREKLIELLAETPGIAWSSSARQMVADYLIANGVTIDKDINVPSKWIPVTEQLPDDGGCVLIALRWGYVDMGWYDKQFERWTSEFVNRYEDGEITHWMPLPEPPKGE